MASTNGMYQPASDGQTERRRSIRLSGSGNGKLQPAAGVRVNVNVVECCAFLSERWAADSSMHGPRSRDTRPITAVVRHVLDWYQAAARDLPWRRTRDPYAIWVSEIMLQQTQVKTVIPFWERWMRAFPDVEALARADEQQVLKLWEGLGYYRRARHLQAAARQICRENAGQFPEAFDAILDLPGVGRYTAGAIASIAFNQAAPILDGNVIRVLCRLGARIGDPKKPEVKDTLWQEASRWVEAAHATGRRDACSHANQALMELGALVCTPRSPDCTRCPIQKHCRGFGSGNPETFPSARTRSPTRRQEYVVAVIVHDRMVWVRQRQDGRVNARLWEFPSLEVDPESGRSAEPPDPWGEHWKWVGAEPLVVVRHAITCHRITQRAYVARWTGRVADLSREAGRWCSRESISGIPMSSAHRKIAKAWQTSATASRDDLHRS